MSIRICRFFPLIVFPASYQGGSMQAPLSGALTLWLSVTPALGPVCRPGLLVTLGVKLIADLSWRSITIPAREIVVHRALGRQVIWQVSPLAARAQDTHDPVDRCAHFPRVCARHAGLAGSTVRRMSAPRWSGPSDNAACSGQIGHDHRRSTSSGLGMGAHSESTPANRFKAKSKPTLKRHDLLMGR